MRLYLVSILFVLFSSLAVQAGEADVVEVKIVKLGENRFQFDVTVAHKDEGWNHYVNKWDVVGVDGIVLGTRILHHPHVNEQPFTRSLSGIEILEKNSTVTVRAHDSVHEYGGKVVSAALP